MKTIYFGREFPLLAASIGGESYLRSLASLETDAALYDLLWDESAQGFVPTRLRLRAPEIVALVDAYSAFEEWMSLRDQGYLPRAALKKVSHPGIRKRMLRNHPAFAVGEGLNLAHFAGPKLETLLCTWTPRRERLGPALKDDSLDEEGFWKQWQADVNPFGDNT